MSSECEHHREERRQPTGPYKDGCFQILVAEEERSAETRQEKRSTISGYRWPDGMGCRAFIFAYEP